VIFIYDPNGVVTTTLDPYSSTFFHKSKYVYILTDGKMNINNALEFASSDISSDAVARLNDVKKQFIDGLATDCGADANYWTTGQSDARYVFITGDVMSGELTITPLSGSYERSTNIDIDGKLIVGNQFRVQKLGISNSQFCDHFSWDGDAYSCVWFYSVKNADDMRTGQVAAVWTSDGTSVSYSHTTTNDIGNTDGIDFDVNMDPGLTTIRLFATITSGTWDIRMLRMFI
jgi:hypothetical protein